MTDRKTPEVGAFGEMIGTPVTFDGNGIVRMTRPDGTKVVPPIEELLADLADCLEDMTKNYVEVRNDLFGFEAAEEIEVIAAGKLIAQARDKALEGKK